MFRSFLLVACILAPLSVNAQGIEVDGIAQEFRPVVVLHPPGVKINVLFWKNGQPTLLAEEHLVRMDDRTVWAAPVGTYAVIQQGSAIVTVNPSSEPDPRPDPIPDPSPAPPPGPKPPPPGPDPDTDKLSVTGIYFFEEQMDRGKFTEQTAVITDAEFRKNMKERGIPTIILDRDLESAKPWQSRIESLPAVLFYESQDRWKVFPVPKTVDELNQLLSKVAK
jgi:hypothetical protein